MVEETDNKKAVEVARLDRIVLDSPKRSNVATTRYGPISFEDFTNEPFPDELFVFSWVLNICHFLNDKTCNRQ